MTRAHLATTLKACAVLVVLVVIAAALGWRSTGGRWFEVQTGSMGRTAPVGSLLITRPVAVADLHEGDVISFHEPSNGQIFSHRVHAVSAAGIQTKGDVNQAVDAWTLHQGDVIGKVTMIVPTLGYALRGVPLFLLVLGFVWLAAALLRPRWREPVRIAGTGLAVAVACFVLQPWVGLERIGVEGSGDDARLEAVATGVLPIRAEVADYATSDRIRPGEIARVPVPSDGKEYHVNAVPSLSGWWWVLIAGVCLTPLVGTLLLGVRAPEGENE